MEDLQTRIEQATANRDKLAIQLQSVQILHTKWQGVVEYLTSLKAAAEQEAAGKEAGAEPIPLTEPNAEG